MSLDRVGSVVPLLEAYTATDDRSSDSKKRTLDFLATGAEGFDREHGDEHITSSAVVLSAFGVLLHEHKLGDFWCGPGGHVDSGELPWESVLRETGEETGIAAWHPVGGPVLVHLDTHATSNGHLHHDMRFVLLSSPEEPSPGEGESPHVGWYQDDAAFQRCDASFAGAIRAAVALQLPRTAARP